MGVNGVIRRRGVTRSDEAPTSLGRKVECPTSCTWEHVAT